jgi:mRNA-degrading endonuclease RelE of RelBE toxin-antitoxin system
MRLILKKRVPKDILSIKDTEIVEWIDFVFDAIISTDNPEKIPGFKWLTGFPRKARITVGTYRIIVEVQSKTIIVYCILHRSIVYKLYP